MSDREVKVEKRLRATELSFTLVMTRLIQLLPTEDRSGIDQLMQGYLETLQKNGSPIMLMLDAMEKSDVPE